MDTILVTRLEALRQALEGARMGHAALLATAPGEQQPSGIFSSMPPGDLDTTIAESRRLRAESLRIEHEARQLRDEARIACEASARLRLSLWGRAEERRRAATRRDAPPGDAVDGPEGCAP